MYENRIVGRIYERGYDAQEGFEDFIRQNALEVLSIYQSQLKVNMRNGDIVYFITIRHESELLERVGGMTFQSIFVSNNVDPDLHNAIRSRLRGPGTVDSDITIFGDE